MANVVKANVFGFEKLFGQLEKLNEKIDEIIDNELKAAALNVETKAKVDCPVDMGTLRRSIHYESGIDGKSKYHAVLSLLPYAPYVEFGTGAKVSVPKGYEEYAMQFKKHKKVVGMNAHPYLIPNFEIEKRELIERLKIIIKNVKS